MIFILGRKAYRKGQLEIQVQTHHFWQVMNNAITPEVDRTPFSRSSQPIDFRVDSRDHLVTGVITEQNLTIIYNKMITVLQMKIKKEDLYRLILIANILFYFNIHLISLLQPVSYILNNLGCIKLYNN